MRIKPLSVDPDKDRRTVPIKIPDHLPARRTLEAEGVLVMDEGTATRQDIRPLRIGLLNLMPDKISTETQIARLLGATPLQIELTLVRITDHATRNTSADHMAAFYRPWSAVRHERFDGFIITGAPVERLDYEDVRYWPELTHIFDWTQTHVHRSLTICWAAQAALYHFHRLRKRTLEQKAFGIFPHRNRLPTSPYLRGMSDVFDVPVSRWTEVPRMELETAPHLQVLADAPGTGAGLVYDEPRHMLHMFNHLEYDTETLAREYARDGGACLPVDYFPQNDPTRPPLNSWRSHAHLLFANWINEAYQTTAFDLAHVGREPLPVS
ncbi:homoserine O-succinyltransferase [Sphingobium sp. B2D3B]|nr:homoserine O-succinyltransferase [Sphingobium sp. B2D3B]MCW2398194.1 homoserine O-succinyltransferase [Sphingobium sp. B2D3C]